MIFATLWSFFSLVMFGIAAYQENTNDLVFWGVLLILSFINAIWKMHDDH